ncbi:MAG: DUF547 domain-containing protein [Candidatus Eisenbacteria bacterium]|nr:DUF547 domain-containing protein [Candidatus Eisenbacteria bacterium]
MTARLAILAGLLLALAARAAGAATQPLPSSDGWQKLLRDYLVVTSARGAPLETRFAYARLATARDGRERLARVRAELLSVPPAKLDDRARLAWAIDAYDFLVIESVMEFLRHPGGARYRSVRDMGDSAGTFFERPVAEIAGKKYSLNAFEEAFVFPWRQKSAQPPSRWAMDPRAHFALVCAAAGCPPLSPRAYLPDSLDAQLDRAVRDALASPRHLRWNEATGALEASEIFEWYAWDFKPLDEMLRFIADHAPPAVRDGMLRKKVARVTRYIPWDWTLNQAPR